MLLAQNLPTELQVCPYPQTHQVGVFWGPNSGGLAVSQVKNPVIIADSRGYDGIIDGTVTPPEKMKILSYLQMMREMY